MHYRICSNGLFDPLQVDTDVDCLLLSKKALFIVIIDSVQKHIQTSRQSHFLSVFWYFCLFFVCLFVFCLFVCLSVCIFVLLFVVLFCFLFVLFYLSFIWGKSFQCLQIYVSWFFFFFFFTNNYGTSQPKQLWLVRVI